ncbi:hypothetical protein SKAU_G00384020 [Synaphobranchus kaupii]|uniref:Uncharacterized protein n=1 Tax=Synaphobranchus kaupii TaxID=118154 RepID=A0A9Q1EE92_SYNKA|nr:hypothetical protein SKAU_G00384020 [Synaphobranchus kaupii]
MELAMIIYSGTLSIKRRVGVIRLFALSGWGWMKVSWRESRSPVLRSIDKTREKTMLRCPVLSAAWLALGHRQLAQTLAHSVRETAARKSEERKRRTR